MARLVKQSDELRREFQRLIDEKLKKEKESLKERIGNSTPSFLSWALKPIAGVVYDIEQGKKESKGNIGENIVYLRLKSMLSDEWVIMNDVVIEPETGEFAQNDHIVIGPPGIFIIETKAWQGSFTGYKDKWKRREGKNWVNCSSPTQQNLRHTRLIQNWLSKLNILHIPAPTVEWIKPVVIFTTAKWVKTTECSVHVINGVDDLVTYLKGDRSQFLSREQIDRISSILASPNLAKFCMQDPTKRPDINDFSYNKSSDKNGGNSVVKEEQNQLSSKYSQSNLECLPNHKQSKTKDGKGFIKIEGTFDDARIVHQHYKKSQSASEIRKDKFKDGVFFFYLN